jgi:hypothetical protein
LAASVPTESGPGQAVRSRGAANEAGVPL